MRATLHILLHFLVPAMAAKWTWLRNGRSFKATFLVLIATMAVDLDHLVADPIYQPDRCSIGFHPLHTDIAIGVYIALFAWEKTRLIGAGLLIHMFLDLTDCIWMTWL